MKIGLDDVHDLAAGVTLLGSGGGGDTATVARMLRHTLAHHGPVTLISAADLPDDALVIPIAATGSITVMIERLPTGAEFRSVIQALTEYLGRPAAALHVFEVGGANALFAVAAAAWAGLPLIDADGMGRAYPRIDQTVLNAAGISATPIALADPSGNQVLIQRARDNTDAERILRAVLPALGGWAATALYPMRAADAHQYAIPGSITAALKLGRDLRAAQRTPWARVSLLGKRHAELLFSGTVVETLRHPRPRTGGTLTIEHETDPQRSLRVEIADEYLLAIDDGQVTASVPDIIALLDRRTWNPVSTEHITCGRFVDVVRFPSPPHWHHAEARRLVSPEAFGLRVLEQEERSLWA